MALIHQAELVPSKIELIRAWAPSQPWCPDGDPAALTAVGAYRLDDPEGQVGMETHLVGTGDGIVLQVPLTYRATPLAGAESALVGTMEHSVLGRRYVYDGGRDPAWIEALRRVIVTGGSQAPLEVQTADGLVRREPDTLVNGTGGSGTAAFSPTESADTTVLTARDRSVIELCRRLDPVRSLDGQAGLTGTWPGQERAVVLAVIG